MPERPILKPGEKIEYLVPREKTPHYPYLDFTSYMFLKSAISEGAHLPVPEKLSKFKDREKRWVRMRNIAGTYFSSPAYYEDLSEAYGMTTVHIGRVVRGVVDSIWENSSPYLKARYPRNMIKLKKPVSEVTRDRRSESRGGVRKQVKELVDSGLTLSEIISKTNKPETSIRGNLASIGYKSRVAYGGSVLAEEVATPTVNREKKAKMLTRVSEGFFGENSHLFLTMSQFFREAGLPRVRNAKAIFEHFMDSRGVQVGELKTSKGRTINYILRTDFDRLFEHVTSEPQRADVTNPSETLDPTF